MGRKATGGSDKDGLWIARAAPDGGHMNASGTAAHDVLADRPTLLLIDNQDLVRVGIRCLLEAHDFPVLGAASHADAVKLAGELQPAVILLDPDTGSDVALDLIGDVREVAGRSRILVLTSHRDPTLCARAMMLGAAGMMYKHEPAEVLFKAIHRLQAGEVWLDRARTAGVLMQMVRRRREIDSSEARIETLTKREREIVAVICEGLRNKQTADRLCISEATARNHLTSILDKLGLASRFELVVFAFRHGLVNR
jgi:two-component system, NarL family, nitrate/nitrite response regulator NarL